MELFLRSPGSEVALRAIADSNLESAVGKPVKEQKTCGNALLFFNLAQVRLILPARRVPEIDARLRNKLSKVFTVMVFWAQLPSFHML